jgi:hypothetical protein
MVFLIADKGYTVISVFPRTANYARAHRILRDIAKCMEEVPHAVQYFAFEPVVPDMAAIAAPLVEPHREDRQDPLHDFGEALSFLRSNHEVEMVAHNAKIRQFEPVFLLGPGNDLQKIAFYLFGVEYILPPVRPGNYVVNTVFFNDSRLSHTL